MTFWRVIIIDNVCLLNVFSRTKGVVEIFEIQFSSNTSFFLFHLDEVVSSVVGDV